LTENEVRAWAKVNKFFSLAGAGRNTDSAAANIVSEASLTMGDRDFDLFICVFALGSDVELTILFCFFFLQKNLMNIYVV
jgi:hypothetical protein